MSDHAVAAAKLVSIYLGKGGKINPWFTRRMKEALPEVRDMVWRKIKEVGLDKMDREEAELAAITQRGTKDKVILTEQEWDILAEKVFPAIFKHPTETAVEIVNRQMSQLPQERRRRITGHSIDPLAQRLQDRFKTLLDCQAEVELLREQVETTEQNLAEMQAKLASVPTKDSILGSLNDEEIIRHFGEQVIKLLTPHEVLSHLPDEVLLEQVPTPALVGKAVERTIEMLQSMGGNLVTSLNALKEEIDRKQPVVKKTIQPPTPHKTTVPKIAMIGLLATQFQTVAERLAGRAKFHYVDKNMRNGETIPDGCNYVVVWTRHCSHSMQDHAIKKAPPGGLIRHSGGVDTLVRKLDGVLN